VNTLLKRTLVLAALAWLVSASAQAADWELWNGSSVPENEVCCLPLIPNTPGGPVTVAESDSSVYFVDIHQTRVKDGKEYKAIQVFRDYTFDATVPVNRWLGGPWGFFYPTGTVDLMNYIATGVNLVSVEIDGQVVPVDPSKLVDLGPDFAPGNDVIWYPLDPRFTTLGSHTLVVTYQPVEEYYYIEPYAAQSLEDPSPVFEGRRVLVPEQVGNPVDGKMVLRYNLTVVPDTTATAVEGSTWGRIKAALLK
jgi:hypothetical protein